MCLALENHTNQGLKPQRCRANAWVSRLPAPSASRSLAGTAAAAPAGGVAARQAQAVRTAAAPLSARPFKLHRRVHVRVDPHTILVRFGSGAAGARSVRALGDVFVGRTRNATVVRIQRGESPAKKVGAVPQAPRRRLRRAELRRAHRHAAAAERPALRRPVGLRRDRRARRLDDLPGLVQPEPDPARRRRSRSSTPASRARTRTSARPRCCRRAARTASPARASPGR